MLNKLGDVIKDGTATKPIKATGSFSVYSGCHVNTLMMHLMTDIVPYGWNEAYTLKANHRVVDQKNIVDTTPDIDKEQAAADT